MKTLEQPLDTTIDLEAELLPALSNVWIRQRERLEVGFDYRGEMSCAAGTSDSIAIVVKDSGTSKRRVWYLLTSGDTDLPLLFPELDPSLSSSLWSSIDLSELVVEVRYFANQQRDYVDIRQAEWGLRPHIFGESTFGRSNRCISFVTSD